MRMPTIRRLWPFNRGEATPQAAPGKAEDATPSERGKEIAALAGIIRGAASGAMVEVNDIFVGSRIVPREHEWYYGAKCRWCHRTAVALHDPHEGQSKLSLSGRGEIHFHCHHCNGLIKATPPQILWFQFEG